MKKDAFGQGWAAEKTKPMHIGLQSKQPVSARPHSQSPVQFAGQFSLNSLNDEYSNESAAGKAGLGLFGSVVGLGRGAYQGAANSYKATAPFQGSKNSVVARGAGKMIGGVGGLLGGIAGGIGGAIGGGLHGLGRGLYSTGSGIGRAIKAAPHAAAKNPGTATGLVAGGIAGGMNTALLGAGATSGAAFMGANMSLGSITGGALNLTTSALQAKRWTSHKRHNQTKWGHARSAARGLHNVNRIMTSGAAAGKWINKAAGGTMTGSGQSMFTGGVSHAATTGTAATNAASHGLQVAGNLGAVGGIISGSMDMLRGGYKFGKARGRNNAFNDALGNINPQPGMVTQAAHAAVGRKVPMPTYESFDEIRQGEARKHIDGLDPAGLEKREAAIEHIKKLNRKKQWAGAGQAASGAMIAAGGAISATGVGAAVGTGLMLTGMALQSAPGAYRGAKQFFRNNAEAKRTMSHDDWKSMQNAKIAENKKRAHGAGFATRAYAGMQRKGMRMHKWWNKKGWKKPTLHNGKPQSYEDWTRQKKEAYNQRAGPTGWGSSVRSLGRWAHHKATLATKSNWDKSDKKKKAAHVEHATTLLGQDEHTREAAFTALGLNHGKYAGGMTGKSLLAQSAGHEDWESVPDDHKAKLIARVMRKGGVQEAATSIQEKREGDAYHHARRQLRGETDNDQPMDNDTSVNTHKMAQPQAAKKAHWDSLQTTAPPVLESNPMSDPSAQKGDESTSGKARPIPPWEMKRDYRLNLLREKPADHVQSRKPWVTGTEFSTEGHEDQ